MGNKENKVSKAMLDNKLSKYGVTRKSFYAMGSMLICILLIVVLSITQASFSSENIATLSFWIDFAILAGLCIYGLIAGQQTGDDVARNNPAGAFRASLSRFTGSFKQIDALFLFAYFDDWLERYREKKLRKKIESILKDNGIHQMEILDLDLTELEQLYKPMKKTWPETGKVTYFLSYTDEQLEIVKMCMTGKVKVSKLPRSFFVDAINQSEKDMWESAAKADKKKSSYLGFSYLYRILALLSMSILSAGLVPATSAGINQAEVWLSLMKRVFCVLTAFVWGIYVGFEIVKIDISYLDFKTDVLNQYYQECELKIYTTKSIEEKAKEEFEKAQQEAKEEVVDGEPNSDGNSFDSGRTGEARAKEESENISS